MHRMIKTALLLGSIALLGAACGDDDDSDDDTAAAEQDDGGATSGGEYDAPSATTTTAAASSAPATVQVADNADHGKILVGPNGHTLYLFTRDTGTTSACTGACASAWPALASPSAPTAGAGVDAGKLSTASGQVAGHVVYNGHLLYYFAQDRAPGQVNGTSVPNWFPLDPAGNQLGG